MKQFLTSLLLSFACSVLAVTPTGLGLGNVATVAAAAPPSAGGSFLVNQTFEGTGYSGGESWTGTSVDPDYTSTALAGSQSLRINAAGVVGNTWVSYAALDAVYVKMLFQVASTNGGNQTIATIRNSATVLATLTLAGANRNLRATAAGGSNGTSSSALPTGTLLYIWFEYVKGSGSNAVARCGWSTTDSKPSLAATGAFVGVSGNGTSTSQADRLYLGNTNNATMEVFYDSVQLAASAF